MSSSMAQAHILHVSGHLSGEPLAFLSQATRELLQAGIGQTVLHPRPDDEQPPSPRPLPAPVRVLELSGVAPGPVAFARELPAVLQSELETGRYTGVHFHGPLVGLVGGIALATAGPGHRPPLYYSTHTPLTAVMLQRAAAALAALPVASGRAEARQLQRLMRREAFTVEPAVDAEFFDVEPAPEGAPLVVAMGHARADSGAGLFAELAARFHFAGEPARFVWIGPHEAAAHDLLRAACVDVTGWLPDGQVRALLARAWVYVQPSRWRKTPRSMLQAMATALPCVATDVPAHREALRHGETGLLARDTSELALQIKTLLDHPALARRLGGAARHEARQRFTSQRLRQSLLALYGLDGTRSDAAAPWVPAAAGWPLGPRSTSAAEQP
jgi:hypothetical protein